MSPPQDQIKSAVKSAEATVVGDVTKIKAWYASHLFWAGAIVGFILALVVSHFV